MASFMAFCSNVQLLYCSCLVLSAVGLMNNFISKKTSKSITTCVVNPLSNPHNPHTTSLESHSVKNEIRMGEETGYFDVFSSGEFRWMLIWVKHP